MLALPLRGAARLPDQANVGRQPLGGSAASTPPGGRPCGARSRSGPAARGGPRTAELPGYRVVGAGVVGKSVALGTLTPAS